MCSWWQAWRRSIAVLMAHLFTTTIKWKMGKQCKSCVNLGISMGLRLPTHYQSWLCSHGDCTGISSVDESEGLCSHAGQCVSVTVQTVSYKSLLYMIFCISLCTPSSTPFFFCFIRLQTLQGKDNGIHVASLLILTGWITQCNWRLHSLITYVSPKAMIAQSPWLRNHDW